MTKISIALSALSVFACAAGEKKEADSTQVTASSTPVASTSPAATTMPDSDAAALGGTGAPAGYLARTDRPDQKLADAKYTALPSGWDVVTGPAHILWDPKNTASGDYTVSATFDQMEKPAHPEAYGIFIGGSDLSGPNQSYLYFLVRGSGEAFAQTRKGDVLTGRIAWQKSYAVKPADSAGKGKYTISMRVVGDSVHFLVNSNGVATLGKKDMPTDGIYGLRINHNLHVHVTPVTITKP